MVQISSLTAFGLLSLASHAVAQTTVKVMPFGASIVTRCWRNNLEAKLRSAGVTNFDFIGGQTGPADCTSQFPGTSSKHEGHPGSLATDFAAKGNLTVWLAAQPVVDVVVMFLGHNDIILGHKPLDQIMPAYDTLLAQMRTKNPKMQIVWSNLTPVDPKRWDSATSPNNSKDVAALAAKIKSVATSKSTAASPVRFVDNFEGYDPVTDTEDGEHPNKSGNEKMASKFLSATKAAINAAKPKRLVNGSQVRDFADVVSEFLGEGKKMRRGWRSSV